MLFTSSDHACAAHAYMLVLISILDALKYFSKFLVFFGFLLFFIDLTRGRFRSSKL